MDDQSAYHSEEELLDQIRQGSRRAWEYVVQKYYNALYAFILSMVKIPEQAEELVQDVFVNFWVKREQINIVTSLKAYLYRAAKNHTLNFLKRQQFERDYQRQVAQEMVIGRHETEDQFHFDQLQHKLQEAIEALPEQSREIFKMSRYDEMTYKEIAEALDIPVRTVHYQIGLALKDLRHRLKGYVALEHFLE